MAAEKTFDEIVYEGARWALLHNSRTPDPSWERELQVAVALVFDDIVILNACGYLTAEAAALAVCWRMSDGFKPTDVPQWLDDLRDRLADYVRANLNEPMVQIILGTRLAELKDAAARRDSAAAELVLETLRAELGPIGDPVVFHIVETLTAKAKPVQGTTEAEPA
jgi:hypothetical protein